MPIAEAPPFVITVDTALAPEEAWRRLTDWPAHGRAVPFTTVTVPPTTAPGTVVLARTALGGPLARVGFDDPMEVIDWEPPRYCRLEKRGRVIHGWAELSVEPLASAGSRVTWREVALPARLPRFAMRPAGVAGRRLFTRVVRRLLSAD